MQLLGQFNLLSASGLVPACMMLLCASVRVKRARPTSSRVFAQGRLRARATSKPWLQFLPLIYLLIDLLPLHCDKVGLGGLSCTLPGLAPEP